jgi:hypothetical protein
MGDSGITLRVEAGLGRRLPPTRPRVVRPTTPKPQPPYRGDKPGGGGRPTRPLDVRTSTPMPVPESGGDFPWGRRRARSVVTDPEWSTHGECLSLASSPW